MIDPMTIAMLNHEPVFPDPNGATEDGLVAIGGDLSVERLREAYRQGVFPWPIPGLPVMTWFSPDPRLVLPLQPPNLSRSVRRALREHGLRITFDHAFDDVVAQCARVPRDGQSGTWISPVMRQAFGALHRAGDAHSAEAWLDDELVAGLYGVAVGGVFCAESMFHLRSGASKVVLATLMATLSRNGFRLLDAQLPSTHLYRYGGEPWPRTLFLDQLAEQRDRICLPTGSWRDVPPADPVSPTRRRRP